VGFEPTTLGSEDFPLSHTSRVVALVISGLYYKLLVILVTLAGIGVRAIQVYTVTLAIAIKYPFGQLNKLLNQGDITPEAIVLASDSRWTYPDGQCEDYATKLFQLASDAGAVYAGVSALGELCLTGLRDRLRGQKAPCSSYFQRLAQHTFQEVYEQATKGIPHNKRVLYMLLGICDASGQAELYRFKYNADFRPERLAGIQAIGCQAPAMIFGKLLRHELKRQIGEGLSFRHRHRKVLAGLKNSGFVVPIPITPYHIAMIAGYALNTIVESKISDFVGGRLQCAVITKEEGFQVLSLRYTTDPTNEGPGFATATIQQRKLKTVIPGTFGCYSLND